MTAGTVWQYSTFSLNLNFGFPEADIGYFPFKMASLLKSTERKKIAWMLFINA